MAIQVVPYTEDLRERWEQFVLNSNNGTMFHLHKFFDYHPKGRFNWNHLVFMDKKEIVAVLPGALMGTTFESPIGASYGSIVTNVITFATALEMIDAFSDYCRERELERALLTPPPFIYQKVISQNLDYALAYRGFSYDKHYISHSIPLDSKSDFLASFQSTARRYVHKYLREQTLTVEINDEYEAFYPILVKNKERHGVRPTHTLDELLRLKKLMPDNLELFLVYKGNKPIAGSLMFACNQQVALCFYNMLLYEYEEYNPIHIVMYEVSKWATERGFKWIDIGVSQDTKAENPMTPSMNLIRFKEKFNSHGILRSTFYKRFI